jgi:hypothetical protein
MRIPLPKADDGFLPKIVLVIGKDGIRFKFIANYPGVFAQFVIKLVRRPSAVAGKKLYLVFGKLVIGYQFSNLIKVATPKNAAGNLNAAFNFSGTRCI